MRKAMMAVAAALAAGILGAAPQWAERIRGPFPILSAPYTEEGELDLDVLVREAEHVAAAGVNGFIWAQSNDAVDLLTVEERKRSFGVLAKAFEGRETIVALGCQGNDTADMEALAREVERLAAAHPRTRLMIVSRPPLDARSEEDNERYYRALARIARRPVIVQTYASSKVPAPSAELLIALAREFPDVFGWIKEESGGEETLVRMRKECAAPEIKTVFSAWGSYGWLDQYRRFGTRGVISERAAYVELQMRIWNALEKGEAAKADEAFSWYLFLMNLRETIPGGHLRSFNLHLLRKRGVFRNCVSREYADEARTPGKWKLGVKTFDAGEIAEIEGRDARIREYLDSGR